jgi:hypothetical protein
MHGHPIVSARTAYLVHTHSLDFDLTPSDSNDGDFTEILKSNHPADGSPMRHIIGVMLNSENHVYFYNNVHLDGNHFDFLHQYSSKDYHNVLP